VDNQIAKTLGELERKLHELEGALAAIDRGGRSSRRAAPEDGAAPAVPERPADPSAGSPLEARSGEQRPAGVAPQRPASVPAQRPDRAAASETAEEHAGATRLIDEAIERDQSAPGSSAPGRGAAGESVPRHSAPGQSAPGQGGPDPVSVQSRIGPSRIETGAGWTGPGSEQPPSVGELLRFRDRLERTARELTRD